MIVFDMETVESAKKFLCESLKINEFFLEQILESSGQVDSLVSRLKLYIGQFELEDVEFIIKHITTVSSLESLRRYGLLNLRETLTKETEIKKFLNGLGIFIDLQNCYLIIDDKKYSFDLSSIKRNGYNNEELAEIGRRLCRDYEINGFIYIDNVEKYSTITKIPEFLYFIHEFNKNEFNKKKLDREIKVCDEWKKIQRKYKYCEIKYKANIDQIKKMTFNVGENDNLDILKESLIKIAVKRALRVLSETIVYMKDDVSIDFDKIIKEKN